MNITPEIARKVLDVVDAGLCGGLGHPYLGQMCVEAAVCYALGEPHGDRPSCVDRAVRLFKIGINDSVWSSDAARAAGLRKVAVAQLGSKDVVDPVKFAEIVTLRVGTELLPSLLEAAEIDAGPCRNAKDLSELQVALVDARKLARHKEAGLRKQIRDGDKLVPQDLDAALAVAEAANVASYYMHNATSDVADARVHITTTYAAADATGHASYGVDYVARATDNPEERDTILCKAAEICLDALRECGSPGCEFLYLCD